MASSAGQPRRPPVPPDARQGEPDRSDHDDYAQVPIAGRRSTWYWRIRVGGASAPFVWIVMQDASPFALFALGFGMCAGIIFVAGRLASWEARVRELRDARR